MTPPRTRAWFSTLVLLILPGGIVAAEQPLSAAARMARYNVVWDSPSKDATGAMPIGNGDVTADGQIGRAHV